jgi:hypothetical protein
VFVARHGSAYESDVGQQPEESGRHDGAGPESAGPTPERCHSARPESVRFRAVKIVGDDKMI